MPAIDLYTLPHKALRTAVAHAGTAIAATDPDCLGADLAVLAAVIGELHHHAGHEEAFIHPLLAAHAPDVLASVERQHAALDADLAALEAAAERVGAGGDPSPAQLLDLHRAVQRFTARNLLHLDHEETVAMPVLWATAPEGALAEVMARFRAAHPDAADLYRRWPDALSPGERQLLGVA